jgi:hypothetical protein
MRCYYSFVFETLRLQQYLILKISMQKLLAILLPMYRTGILSGQNGRITPNELFHVICDRFANRYQLSQLAIQLNSSTNSLLCSNSGNFDLYFGQGSGLLIHTGEVPSSRTDLTRQAPVKHHS